MNSPYNRIRIVLADDHEIYREGFDTLLKKQPDIELIGEATNGAELVQLVAQVNPDVVLTDIKMPEMDGIKATKIITQCFPEVQIIALTMFDEDNFIIDMLEAGARGYLVKNAHKSEIFEAIKSVYRRETYYCKHTSGRLTQLIARSRFNPHHNAAKIAFTQREIDVIVLICREFTNKEIASELNLSTRTIESYRENIQQKMKVKNAAGIAVYAIRHGIFTL